MHCFYLHDHFISDSLVLFSFLIGGQAITVRLFGSMRSSTLRPIWTAKYFSATKLRVRRTQSSLSRRSASNWTGTIIRIKCTSCFKWKSSHKLASCLGRKDTTCISFLVDCLRTCGPCLFSIILGRTFSLSLTCLVSFIVHGRHLAQFPCLQLPFLLSLSDISNSLS